MSGWFAVIDTAQDSSLHALVESVSPAQCLFSGGLDPVLAAAAPYLATVADDGPLMTEWKSRGIGKNWGILCRSTYDFAELRRHFRRFLQAKLPDGTIALFRFYDPRVFNTYIRAATPAERAPWFDAVDVFAVEGVVPGVVHNYRLLGGVLYDGNQIVASWRGECRNAGRGRRAERTAGARRKASRSPVAGSD